MGKNKSCKYYPSEENTEEDAVKKCSKLDVVYLSKEEIGKGTYGIIYPIIVKTKPNLNPITLILKRITSISDTKSEQKKFIKSMKFEVEYSYKMGEKNIGPNVYDTFYNTYIDDENRYITNQYILMEKFELSVSNWLVSGSKTLNVENCNYVSDQMLELLFNQIFKSKIYCIDIKVDNFVLNINPLKIRMIDFGIDWCNSKLPNDYRVIKILKKFSSKKKKEIFYCICVLQLFINIINLKPPIQVIKMILKPFYKDTLFNKYILQEYVQKYVLKNMLNNNEDHAYIFSHYIRTNENQTTDEIIQYISKSINKVTKLYNN